MLRNDQRNAQRLDFLNLLANEPWSPKTDKGDILVEELFECTKPWATSKRDQVLKNLTKPTEQEVGVLLSSIRFSGGISFMRD